MNNTLFTALGMMLLFEGLMPFLLPKSWRETFKKMIELKDGQLRFIGLISMIFGLLLIWLSH